MPIIFLTSRSDFKVGSSGDDTIYGLEGDDTIMGLGGNDVLIGGAGNDQLQAGIEGNSSLVGGDGDDTLYGGGGNDTLDGGAGVNILNGISGNDVYYISNTTSKIQDWGGGIDTAYVSASFVKIPSSIENVIYTNGALALPYWIDALLPDDASGSYFRTLLGDAKTFSYIFPASLPAYDTSPNDASGYAAFSATQITRTKVALNYISSIIDVHFELTDNVAALNTISFANNRQPISAGYAIKPGESQLNSDVFLDSSEYSTNATLADSTYGALTLMHEIGHALGIKHPFSSIDPAGGIAAPPYLSGSEESLLWTVMSYTQYPGQYHLAYRPLDIAALQYLYGPAETARTGNDTYEISSTDSNFIWDGSGVDTITLANVTQGSTAYLTPGYWGFVGSKSNFITAPGQITVNFGTMIENLTGSIYNDVLYGNQTENRINGLAGNDLIEGWDGDDSLIGGLGNDTLNGGSGSDSIDGGEGQDTAIFSGTLANYSITKTGNSYTVLDKRSYGNRDNITNIESLQFDDKSVNLTIQAIAAKAPRADLQRLMELYVAFFNRIPDANGLEYWLGKLAGGQKMTQIAESFYNAGVQFSSLTGFSATMTNSDFINVIYRNVLGRADGADSGGLAYWNGELMSNRATRGSLVSDILTAAHAFKNDSTYSYVANLLDNKIAVAQAMAVDWGLSYNTAGDSISQGMLIASKITPAGTIDAIGLIGISPSEIHLT